MSALLLLMDINIDPNTNGLLDQPAAHHVGAVMTIGLIPVSWR